MAHVVICGWKCYDMSGGSDGSSIPGIRVGVRCLKRYTPSVHSPTSMADSDILDGMTPQSQDAERRGSTSLKRDWDCVY